MGISILGRRMKSPLLMTFQHSYHPVHSKVYAEDILKTLDVYDL